MNLKIFSQTKCIFCGRELIFKPEAQGLSACMICENCGWYSVENFFLEDGSCYHNLKDKLHIIAGYLYETNHDYLNDTKPRFVVPFAGLTPSETFDRILKSPVIPKTVGQKLDKLLVYLYMDTDKIGKTIKVQEIPPSVAYVQDIVEVYHMVRELVDMGFAKLDNPASTVVNNSLVKLSHKGFERAEQLLSTNIDSKRVFVAMQFRGSLLDGIRDNAIKPACAAFGFEAYTVDEEEHNEGIFDKIIAGIRTSKFVIADLTYENAGAYFEAGYAQGLGLEVFRCCNQEWFDEHGVHFDLRHYNLIVWKDAEHLKERLVDRIGAVFPDAKLVEG